MFWTRRVTFDGIFKDIHTFMDTLPIAIQLPSTPMSADMEAISTFGSAICRLLETPEGQRFFALQNDLIAAIFGTIHGILHKHNQQLPVVTDQPHA